MGHTQILGVCIPTTNTGRPWSTFVLQMMMFFPQKCYSDSAYSAGTCNLDLANGAIHPTTGLLLIKNNLIRHVDVVKKTQLSNVRISDLPAGEYSYFMTVDYPWVPVYYYGDEGKQSLCSAD